MEAIILAGGLGTRLQSVVSDVPKPMAPVAGKPFLSYLLEYLSRYQIHSVVLSTGYKHHAIEKFFGQSYKNISIKYSIELSPLGTGGAIRKALQMVHEENVLVLNGDTLFNVNINEFIRYHQSSCSDITLALKYLENFDRYGTVLLNDNDEVIGFEEKQCRTKGYINGGVYLINKNLFEKFELPYKFSFESDFLEKYVENLNIRGYTSSGYFIDIGIPIDYERAQKEMKGLFNE